MRTNRHVFGTTWVHCQQKRFHGWHEKNVVQLDDVSVNVGLASLSRRKVWCDWGVILQRDFSIHRRQQRLERRLVEMRRILVVTDNCLERYLSPSYLGNSVDGAENNLVKVSIHEKIPLFPNRELNDCKDRFCQVMQMQSGEHLKHPLLRNIQKLL